MLIKAGEKSIITSDKNDIENATKIILPGVGHFDYCMRQLRNAPFYHLLDEKVLKERVPILGVCVGCQMLMEKSEEGKESGLGWIQGEVVKFNSAKLPANYKVPHMGWSDITPKNNCALYDGIKEPRFYFVHSYHLSCRMESNITATAEYGYQFPASVLKDNFMGVQFHPEKSHKFGMKLYQNFVNLY